MERDDTEPIDAELIDREELLMMRRPSTPINLDHLSTLKSGAIEVIEARVTILETLRRAAIRSTSPADWLLFKSPEEQGGQVVGYLQDCGADRVRDLYGIEVFGISAAEKIVSNDPTIFHYLIRGSGRCKLTGQILEQVEGGRSSTDDFCKNKMGLELDLAVRKAARANLDGGITRELAGMKSVPLADIAAAWDGTTKKIEDCRRGRGFGTRDERLGAETADVGIVPPPCPVCRREMALRKGSKGMFYSCPDYKAHGRDSRTIDLEEWKKNPASRKAAAPAATNAPADTKGPGRVEPPPASEIFGREPGMEG